MSINTRFSEILKTSQVENIIEHVDASEINDNVSTADNRRTLLMVCMDASLAFVVGFLIFKERTVSSSKSFRPSLLVFGLKQKPPESSKDPNDS